MAELSGVAIRQIVVYALLLFLSWSTVLTRLYVRGFMLKRVEVDDYLMIMAVIGFTAIAVLAIEMSIFGFGQSSSNLSPSDVEDILKIFWYQEILYGATTVVLKFSIMVLLLGLATKRFYRYLIKATAFFYLLTALIFVTTSVFRCHPISRYWKINTPGNCMSMDVFVTKIYLGAVINIVTDGIFSILPGFLIRNIQLDRRTKISVTVVLGIGITTCVVNIVRFKYIGSLKDVDDRTSLSRLSVHHRPFDCLLNADVSFSLVLTSVLEIAIGIIAASLATLRPILKKIPPRLRRFSVTMAPPMHRRSSRSSALEPMVSEVKFSVTKLWGKVTKIGENDGVMTRGESTRTGQEPSGICQNDVDEWREICENATLRAGTESKLVSLK